MDKRPLYTKTFTRDFCLPALEAWYRGESLNNKEWTDKKQERFPYIVFERKDGTVNCYYDLEGVEWLKDLLWNKASHDSSFIPMLEQTIPEKLRSLRPIYESQVTLNHDELVKFITELEEYYPWFEAMWWLMEMSEDELKGLNVDSLRTVRRDTEKLSSGTNIVIRKSLENIYPEIKQYVHVLRTSEIKSNTLPSINELIKRDNGFFLTADQLFIDTTVEEMEERFSISLEKTYTSNDIVPIQGNSAYKGKVEGVVCKIMGHKDIGKIKEGEILVSPMTMPDMLPAMQKARAIVTDEGGITCHAAIVARELKKPCIIGTKIATQVLKDGDLVEVDADKGVVTILKQ